VVVSLAADVVEMATAVLEAVGDLWLKLSKRRPKRFARRPEADGDELSNLPRLTKRTKRDKDGQE
jgi:hypothetical protein